MSLRITKRRFPLLINVLLSSRKASREVTSSFTKDVAAFSFADSEHSLSSFTVSKHPLR